MTRKDKITLCDTHDLPVEVYLGPLWGIKATCPLCEIERLRHYVEALESLMDREGLKMAQKMVRT